MRDSVIESLEAGGEDYSLKVRKMVELDNKNLENNLPPPDTRCIVCKNQCTLECVKCQKCKQSVHTDCTRLPVYAIVNFFNTRCQYTCEECVRKQLGEAVDH